MKRKTKERAATSVATSGPRSQAVVPPVDLVSRRARDIWLARGQPQGCDDEIWYEAERQLATEMSQGMPPLEQRGIPVSADERLEEKVNEVIAHHTLPERRASATSLPP